MDHRALANGTADKDPTALFGTAPPAAWVTLAILVAVVVLKCLDQVVLTISTEPMRHSLELTDTQIGLIQSVGVTLALALGALPVAWMADRYEQRLVLGGCIVFWSVATSARAYAQSFEEVLISTVGMSLAEAGLYPIAYAIIPKLFGGTQRTTANLIFYAGGTLGYSLSLMLGGWLFRAMEGHGHLIPGSPGDAEPWRTTTFVVGAIGPVLAMLVLVMRTRLQAEDLHAVAVRGVEASLLAYLKQNWQCVAGILGSLGFNMVAFATILAWLPPAAARAYGLSPAQVGEQFGLLLLAAVLTGLCIAVILTRLAARKSGDLLAVEAAPYLSVISALGFASIGIAGSLAATYAATFVAFSAVVAFSSLLPGVYQAMTPVVIRVRFIAVATAVSIAFSAIGPFLVGYLSDQLRDQSGALHFAIACIGTPVMLISAVLAGWARRPTRETLSKVQVQEAAAVACACKASLAADCPSTAR